MARKRQQSAEAQAEADSATLRNLQDRLFEAQAAALAGLYAKLEMYGAPFVRERELIRILLISSRPFLVDSQIYQKLPKSTEMGFDHESMGRSPAGGRAK